jgi:hypothetical protein
LTKKNEKFDVDARRHGRDESREREKYENGRESAAVINHPAGSQPTRAAQFLLLLNFSYPISAERKIKKKKSC